MGYIRRYWAIFGDIGAQSRPCVSMAVVCGSGCIVSVIVLFKVLLSI